MLTPQTSPTSGVSVPLIDPQAIASIRALDDGGDEVHGEAVGACRAASRDLEYAAVTGALAGLGVRDGH